MQRVATVCAGMLFLSTVAYGARAPHDMLDGAVYRMVTIPVCTTKEDAEKVYGDILQFGLPFVNFLVWPSLLERERCSLYSVQVLEHVIEKCFFVSELCGRIEIEMEDGSILYGIIYPE